MECSELAVGEFHTVASIDVFILLGVEECGVVDGDVFEAGVARESVGADGGFGSSTNDVGEMDVVPLWHVFCILWDYGFAIVRLHAVALVGIGALEDDGFVFDVGHHDVANVDAFGFASSANAALEAESGVGA